MLIIYNYIGDMMIQIIGFIFIVVLGTLCHFIYEWSNHNPIAGLFCAVNESTWEHIKMALGPSFIWLLMEIFLIGSNPNFVFSKCISLLTIILFIPIFFYGYRYIFKKDILILDILDFILAILLSQILSYIILNGNSVSYIVTIFSFIIIIVILVMYLVFTYFPPNSFLFIDPMNNKTGFKAHIYNDKKSRKLL